MDQAIPPQFLDKATGLFHGPAFEVIADQVLKVAARERREIVLFLVLLEGFEELSEPQAAQAAEDMAGLMRASFRESDLLGRLDQVSFTMLGVAPESMVEMLTTRLHENIQFHNENNGRDYTLRARVRSVMRSPQSIRSAAKLIADARQA
jgi:GGDEF domain-containing protein